MSTIYVVNGSDLDVGQTVIHPTTRRHVTLDSELYSEHDRLRRFWVFGPRGGMDALVIGETSPIELVVS